MMDAIVIATLICSGLAAAFSAVGVVVALGNQKVTRLAAERLEERNAQWTPPSSLP